MILKSVWVNLSYTKCEKLLGVKTDEHLKFDDHVNSLCKKASRKSRALARVTPHMSVDKRKLVMNSFFNGKH